MARNSPEWAAPANAVAAFVDVLTLSATATATSWWDHIHFGRQGYGALG